MTPRDGDEYVSVETHGFPPTMLWVPADRPLLTISDAAGHLICSYDAVTDMILPPDTKAIDIMRALARFNGLFGAPPSPSKSPGDGGQVQAGDVEKP